jgi:hypothetical protein
MRVLITKLGAGPGGVRSPGDLLEVSEAEGQMLIADGAARQAKVEAPRPPAPPPAKLETAEAPTPPAAEAAVTPPAPRPRTVVAPTGRRGPRR